MTTKKNLVKSMFMNVLTAGIFATALTACSDELNNEVQSFDGPKSESFEFTNLEQYSYSVPVKVNVEGDWEIDLQFNDEENEFCYVSPSKGHGPAEIKLCVLDNWTNQRNEGKMTIRDLNNSNNNQSFRLMQKCNLDNSKYMALRSRTRGEGDDAAASESKSGIEQGDIIYGVGYGYNVTMKPGIDAIASNPIIALELLKEDGKKYGYGPKVTSCATNVRVSTFTGSTISEVTKNMEISASLKGSKGGFAAEAGATFTESQQKSTTDMYAFTAVDVTVRKAYLAGIDGESVFEYMTPNAKRAIQGTGTRKTYASTPEGFKRLFKDYGTHLIVRTNLGGRLRLATTVSKSVAKSDREVKAHANCSYKNKLLESTINSSAGFKSTYEKNKKYVETNISAAGGSIEQAVKLSGVEKENSEATDAWLTSLSNNEHLTVVGFGDDKAVQMIPLYELVDTEKEGGQERYDKMKEYMEHGMMQDNAYDGTQTYTTGDILKINILSINEMQTKYGKVNPMGEYTLVYEVWNKQSDRMEAVICSEYIPQINTTGMVQTIYPVDNSNNADFRRGRFLGDESRQACDILWNDNGTVTINNKAEKKGKESTIYFLGGEFFTVNDASSLGDATIVNATITGKYLEAKMFNGQECIYGLVKESNQTGPKWKYDESFVSKESYDNNYHYPLVKIGNRIWTREDFAGNIPHGENAYNRWGVKADGYGMVYYTNGAIQHMSAPKGFHIAKKSDFENLKSLINSKLGSKSIGEMMQTGGNTGFEMQWMGWYTYDYDRYWFNINPLKGNYQYGSCYWNYQRKCYNQRHMEFYTGDEGHVRIQENNFDICSEVDHFAMRIRLVMNY
jgi:uncharacterized protein (TIGR02145 family)